MPFWTPEDVQACHDSKTVACPTICALGLVLLGVTCSVLTRESHGRILCNLMLCTVTLTKLSDLAEVFATVVRQLFHQNMKRLSFGKRLLKGGMGEQATSVAANCRCYVQYFALMHLPNQSWFLSGLTCLKIESSVWTIAVENEPDLRSPHKLSFTVLAPELEKDDNVPKIIVHCKQISEPVTTTNFGSKHDRLQFTIVTFNFSQLDHCTIKWLVKEGGRPKHVVSSRYTYRCAHTHTHSPMVQVWNGWHTEHQPVPMKRLQWIKQSSLPRLPCSEGMSGSLSTIWTSELETDTLTSSMLWCQEPSQSATLKRASSRLSIVSAVTLTGIGQLHTVPRSSSSCATIWCMGRFRFFLLVATKKNSFARTLRPYSSTFTMAGSFSWSSANIAD